MHCIRKGIRKMAEMSGGKNNSFFSEHKLIACVAENMLRHFEAKVDWKTAGRMESAVAKKPYISKAAPSFWESAVWRFLDFSDTLTLRYTKPLLEWGSAADEEDDNRTEEPAGESEPEATSKVIWKDDIDTFEDAYWELADRYLWHVSGRREIDARFSKLLQELRTAKERKWTPQNADEPLIKRLDFSYIVFILNLRNKTVCALLPYLLTAYVFNYPTCALLYQNSDFLERAFGPDKLSSSEAPKTREQIRRFAHIFSMESVRKRPIARNESTRPFTNFFQLENPGINHEAVLWEIFEAWCGIIQEEAKKNRLYRLKKNLDIEKSSQLLHDALEP